MSVQKCLTEAEQKFKMWKQSEDSDGEIPIDPNYQPTLIAFGILSGKTSDEIEENKKFVERRMKEEKENIWDIQYDRHRWSLFIYTEQSEGSNDKELSILSR